MIETALPARVVAPEIRIERERVADQVQRIKTVYDIVERSGAAFPPSIGKARLNLAFALDRTHALLEARKGLSRVDQLKAAAYGVAYGTIVEGWMVGGATASVSQMGKGAIRQSAAKAAGNFVGAAVGFARGVRNAAVVLRNPIR
jgi:hypothetical protein